MLQCRNSLRSRLTTASCATANDEEEEMEYSDRGTLKMEPSAKRTEAINGCAERGLEREDDEDGEMKMDDFPLNGRDEE